MTERKTPILLRRGPVSGKVMALYRYTRQTVRGRDLINASGKQDVSHDFYALMLEELIDGGAEHIIGILDGVADGESITTEQQVEVRVLRERLKVVVEAHNDRLAGPGPRMVCPLCGEAPNAVLREGGAACARFHPERRRQQMVRCVRSEAAT